MSAFDRRRKAFEDVYRKRIERELKRYGKSIALQIEEGVAPETFLLSGQFLSREKLDKTLRNLWETTGAYFVGYSHRRLRRMGLNVPKVETWTETVDKYWQNEGAQNVNTIVKNKEDEIRNIIKTTAQKGQEEGLGIKQISKNITKSLEGKEYALKSKFNADRIARTEVASASNSANAEQIYQIEGGYKMWITARDRFVRGTSPKDTADHISLHGVKIPNERTTTFPNGLTEPHMRGAPANEVVNCRCSMVWVAE